ncbi:MAG: ATP-binding protein [Butyrivibrio sp.]|nr:ATP-binding protein [Butyrivibrio sp.]
MKYVIIFTIILAAAGLFTLIFFALRRAMYNMIDRRIERFQSELIEKQIRETQNMYRQVRGWRHDYRNHIQNMKIQLAKKNYDKLDSYLSELAADLSTVDTVIKTGNVTADAVLNTKLDLAAKLGIRINVTANVPAGLTMSDVELCAVMGNLLDNALEACEKLKEEQRFLRVYMGNLKNQFYLSVQNSAGKVKKADGKYLTTKSGDSHGYGIFRIDRIVLKYGGYVNRQNEEGIFATEILIPLG